MEASKTTDRENAKAAEAAGADGISLINTLLGMAVCGVLGGIAGRCVNRRIPSATVDRLFIGMMGLILAICVYNYLRFT